MANETTLSSLSILNHLPSAKSSWAADWVAAHGEVMPVSHKLMAYWSETEQKLRSLMGDFSRVKNPGILDRVATAEPPPIELWCRGEVPPPPYVAVVGPRCPSEAAKRVVERFVVALASSCTIVSGFAMGIDRLALRAALGAGGRVMAVLPLGLTDCLRDPLARSVVASGALIAERLFVPAVTKGHFLYRNRLIASVADLVFAPEAAERSGTYNTLVQAVRLGVDVMVAPGDLTKESARGTNRLIRDGAAVAIEPDDIAMALGLALKPASTERWRVLAERPLTILEMAEQMDISLADLQIELQAAERTGVIARDHLGRYRLLADRPQV